MENLFTIGFLSVLVGGFFGWVAGNIKSISKNSMAFGIIVSMILLVIVLGIYFALFVGFVQLIDMVNQTYSDEQQYKFLVAGLGAYISMNVVLILTIINQK